MRKRWGKCSWSRDFATVPGWKAIATTINGGYTKVNGENHSYDSYKVIECPQFELLKSIKQKIFNNAGKVRPKNRKR
jgi:hypothetical protein